MIKIYILYRFIKINIYIDNVALYGLLHVGGNLLNPYQVPRKTESMFWFGKSIYSSPISKYIFPLSQYIVFQLLYCPFCLNSSQFCVSFTLVLPFLFFFPLLLFPLSPFHIFPPNDISWYPPRELGYVPIHPAAKLWRAALPVQFRYT